MQDHIQKVINKDIHNHYLGKNIQNEIIETIGQAVLQKIVARIKSAKYFAVILDCTPDISHQEQMSMVRDVAAAPQTPQLGGGGRPTLGAQVSLKLLFGYVTIFSSADLFTTDLNYRKKLACDIISECNVILSRRI